MRLVGLSTVLLFLTSCGDGNRGTNDCASRLTYVTNAASSGEHAIHHAAEYRLDFSMGEDNIGVSAVIDTASSSLVVNESDYEFGVDSVIGSKPFWYGSGEATAINAKDSLDIACIGNFPTRFAITAKESLSGNRIGLAYSDYIDGDTKNKIPPFLDQLIKAKELAPKFSIALCGTRGTSRLLLGGFDQKMDDLIGNFIPIIEKSAFVVPARSLRRKDTKQEIAMFPSYNPATKLGTKTIIDSAKAFLLLPTNMAELLADDVKNAAKNLGILPQFPDGFFRTERASTTKTLRFVSLQQLRQFPSYEIGFTGSDGTMKYLELSPLYYFKEMDKQDTLVRVFAVRESTGTVVLGHPFLENHYAYFEPQKGRIGFGNIDIACME